MVDVKKELAITQFSDERTMDPHNKQIYFKWSTLLIVQKNSINIIEWSIVQDFSMVISFAIGMKVINWYWKVEVQVSRNLIPLSFKREKQTGSSAVSRESWCYVLSVKKYSYPEDHLISHPENCCHQPAAYADAEECSGQYSWEPEAASPDQQAETNI